MLHEISEVEFSVTWAFKRTYMICSEEKLWQEGILRHMPVFGNIVNCWSPLNKENGGSIKGRSFYLTAGVVESIGNIYRYNMQGAASKALTRRSRTRLVLRRIITRQCEVTKGNV